MASSEATLLEGLYAERAIIEDLAGWAVPNVACVVEHGAPSVGATSETGFQLDFVAMFHDLCEQSREVDMLISELEGGQ